MKTTQFIAGFAVLALGFGAGAGFQRWQQQPVNDLVQRFPISQTAANSSRCVGVLRLLRAGEIDRAANTLETYLDGDLIGLGPAYHAATPEDREAARAAQAIHLAREYRQAHPHTPPDPQIAQAVAATLSIPTPE